MPKAEAANVRVDFVIDGITLIQDDVPHAEAAKLLGAVEHELRLSSAARTDEASQVALRIAIYKANQPGGDAALAEATIPLVFWLSWYHYRDASRVRQELSRGLAESVPLILRVMAEEKGGRLRWGLWIGPSGGRATSSPGSLSH